MFHICSHIFPRVFPRPAPLLTPTAPVCPASHVAGRQPRLGDALRGALQAAARRVALALPGLAAPDKAEGAFSWPREGTGPWARIGDTANHF